MATKWCRLIFNIRKLDRMPLRELKGFKRVSVTKEVEAIRHHPHSGKRPAEMGYESSWMENLSRRLQISTG